MTTNQKGMLNRPAGVLLVVTFKGIWLNTQKIKSELSVRFAEVKVTHHAFSMLYKPRQVQHVSVKVYTKRLYA